jgi:hypothetical protein
MSGSQLRLPWLRPFPAVGALRVEVQSRVVHSARESCFLTTIIPGTKASLLVLETRKDYRQKAKKRSRQVERGYSLVASHGWQIPRQYPPPVPSVYRTTPSRRRLVGRPAYRIPCPFHRAMIHIGRWRSAWRIDVAPVGRRRTNDT